MGFSLIKLKVMEIDIQWDFPDIVFWIFPDKPTIFLAMVVVSIVMGVAQMDGWEWEIRN